MQNTDKNHVELTEQIYNFLKDYKLENGKLPTTKMVGAKFQISQNVVIRHYRFLEKENKLNLNTSRYKPGEKFFSENGHKKHIKELVSSITIIVIRIVMGLISIGACILSTWFTANFLQDSLGPFFSYILSIIMIMFSVISFEAIIIFYKNNQRILVILFSFLWIIVLIFSMFSTIATQYNERIKINNQAKKNNTDKIINRTAYNLLLTEEIEIRESLQLKKQELQPYLNILSSYESKEDRKTKDDKWTYWNVTEKIKDLNTELQKLKVQLDKKRDELRNELAKINDKKDKTGIVKGTEQETKSFYIWMSEILQIETQYVQFWPSTFPAVFIDIIAPLALAICMFLKKKE